MHWRVECGVSVPKSSREAHVYVPLSLPLLPPLLLLEPLPPPLLLLLLLLLLT